MCSIVHVGSNYFFFQIFHNPKLEPTHRKIPPDHRSPLHNAMSHRITLTNAMAQMANLFRT
jgi:hypothetical protein